MKENILEVLMYLFEHHLQENYRMQLNQDKLLDELKDAGFSPDEIDALFVWLQGLAQDSELGQTLQQETIKSSFRVLAPMERDKIGLECWGFIVFLEHAGIIDATCREIVIADLMDLEDEEIDLQQVKSVITMALLHNSNSKDTLLPALEQLLLAGNVGSAH